MKKKKKKGKEIEINFLVAILIEKNSFCIQIDGKRVEEKWRKVMKT